MYLAAHKGNWEAALRHLGITHEVSAVRLAFDLDRQLIYVKKLLQLLMLTCVEIEMGWYRVLSILFKDPIGNLFPYSLLCLSLLFWPLFKRN